MRYCVDVMVMFVHHSNASIILEALLGPRRQELYKVIPITIVYLLIFITGVVGNVCTCLVIARNRYMQTTTNCYLFNLAVSDLLVLLLGLPQETYSFWSAYPWVFGETFCLVRILAAETSTYASILTITAFTAERYVAICHPMRAQTLSGLQRAVRVIALIWLVSGVCSVPMVMQFGVVLQEVGGEVLPDSAQCIIRPRGTSNTRFQMSTFLFFFTPMTIITVLYVLIGLDARARRRRSHHWPCRQGPPRS
jgi:neuromedin U receptor 1